MKQPVLFGNGGSPIGDWFQTIAVSAPSGASITVSGGGETLTATGTGTYYAFAVHNKNTQYTITVSMDGVSAPSQTVTTGTVSGVISFVEVKFGTINVTLSNDFVGETVTCTQGGTTISKVASTTSLTFRVPSTGTWTIASTVSGDTYTVSANITDIDVAENVRLETIVTIPVTIYGATNDTITFTDESGIPKTEVFANGESSKAINITVRGSGTSITFTSSVANNPDNLSQPYSKTITVTSSDTEIYVMPDHCLYWYGWKGAIENAPDMQGSINWLTNYVQLITSADYQYHAGIVSSNEVIVSKLHTIASRSSSNINGPHTQGRLNASSGKSITSNSLASIDLDTSRSHKVLTYNGTCYPMLDVWAFQIIEAVAFWYE